MTEQLCSCAICNGLAARGEARLAGVSLSRLQHLLPTDFPDGRQSKRAPVLPHKPDTFSRDHIAVIVREELRRHLDTLAQGVGLSIGTMVREAEARITQNALSYRGLWEPDTTYRINNIVNHGGTAFVCLVDAAKAKPGTDAAQWGVLCARGRDGRDAPATAVPSEPPEQQQRTARTAARSLPGSIARRP